MHRPFIAALDNVSWNVFSTNSIFVHIQYEIFFAIFLLFEYSFAFKQKNSTPKWISGMEDYREGNQVQC